MFVKGNYFIDTSENKTRQKSMNLSLLWAWHWGCMAAFSAALGTWQC